jgi:alcohol dehydrogenase YqhD (iron-dependent ADH family)
MEKFVSYNPTTVHFGKNVINDLGRTLSKYGNKVLLVYGKNSIKQCSIYSDVIDQLKSVNAQIFEYSGIKSNPIIEDVDAAAEVGRKNNVDIILAVGGGSVIDSAKIISITIPVKNSGWDFYENIIKPEKAIPLICVLTLAATGTESNRFAVVQNNKSKNKDGYRSDLIYPVHAFLDPQYTFSVPKNYTAYGITDLIAHCLEAWFGAGDATLSDRFIIANIKEALEYGPLLLNNLSDYELRAKIMYAATTALNGFTMLGKKGGDWGVHSIGHVISLLYDIPHGASLSIAYPAWMRTIKERTDKVDKLGFELFGIHNADETISRLEKFFKSIDSPIKLVEVKIHKDKKQEIYDTLVLNKAGGSNFKLTNDDYNHILELMF